MRQSIFGWIASLALAMTITTPAIASPVVADMSNYEITMDSNFNGTRLFVFGARNESGDVVAVMRGPLKNYVVRKKEKFAGIWVNKDKVKLWGVPDFYAIASSKPLDKLNHAKAFKLLAIGHENLFNKPADPLKWAFYDEFTQAFIAHQISERLYAPTATSLSFMGETLFKTVIEFPDNIPPGKYNTEVYLLNNNTIIGTHVLPIEVKKVGLDGFLYDYAHNQPLFYGISAVILALSAGWFAGRLFERF